MLFLPCFFCLLPAHQGLGASCWALGLCAACSEMLGPVWVLSGFWSLVFCGVCSSYLIASQDPRSSDPSFSHHLFLSSCNHMARECESVHSDTCHFWVHFNFSLIWDLTCFAGWSVLLGTRLWISPCWALDLSFLKEFLSLVLGCSGAWPPAALGCGQQAPKV